MTSDDPLPWGNLLAQTDPPDFQSPFFWVQFGLLGVIFLMLVLRRGLMTTNAHEEVMGAQTERLEELRQDRDEWKQAYFTERDAREKESDARGLAEVRADAAVEAARTVAAAMDALRTEFGRRR